MRLLWCESGSDRLLPGSNLHPRGSPEPGGSWPHSLPAFSAADRAPSPRAKGAIVTLVLGGPRGTPLRQTAAIPQRFGSVRGSPKCRKTPVSLNQVIAVIASPASVSSKTRNAVETAQCRPNAGAGLTPAHFSAGAVMPWRAARPGPTGCGQPSGRSVNLYTCAAARLGCRRGQRRPELPACRDSELREDAVEVGADGAVGHVESLAYLSV